MGAGYCQWGGFTDRNIDNTFFRPLGPLAAAGERVTYGSKARKYIMMSSCEKTKGHMAYVATGH